MSSAEEALQEEDLAPGTAVGEYVVDRKLGEGAFGKVFGAVHPLIGKQAAIKVLSRGYAADPQVVSRFVAEARAVNQIASRNIIDIFSFGRLSDGRHYYIMELLEGAPLDRLLADRGRLTIDEALPILRGIARALDAAHAKGVVHRDLKPANVFVSRDEDGQAMAKLLDFGIAKLFDEKQPSEHKTRTGAPIGTPYYMSPEQCQAASVTAKTDIYAFGVMCFQLLTGQLPFVGQNYVEILVRHIQDPPPPPSTRSRAVPEALDGPILRMMAKAPEERPDTAGAALAALEEAALAAGLTVPIRAASSGPLFSGAEEDRLQESALNDPGLAATFLSQRAAEPARPALAPWRISLAIAVVAAAAGLLVVASARLDDPPELAPEPATEPPVAVEAPVPPPEAPRGAVPEAPPAIEIRFEGTPAGALIRAAGGRELGRVPVTLTLPASEDELEVEISAAGYLPRRQRLALGRDLLVQVILERARAPKPATKTRSPRPDRDAIEEAF